MICVTGEVGGRNKLMPMSRREMEMVSAAVTGDRGGGVSKSGNRFGVVVVKLKCVWEPSGPSKGASGDPEGFVVVEYPPIVRCEDGGAI